MFAFTQTEKCGMIVAKKDYSRWISSPWVGITADDGGVQWNAGKVVIRTAALAAAV